MMTTPVVKERKLEVKMMLKRNRLRKRMRMLAQGRKIQKKRRKLIENL